MKSNTISQSINDLVTIGITAFKRPQSLVRLVRSIRRFYPTVRIVVADNGDDYADLSHANVLYLKLPFDCGLSAARNALVARLETPFLQLLDDDFEITRKTRFERLLDILMSDNEIAAASGSHWDPKAGTARIAMDLNFFRGCLTQTEPRGAFRFTPSGTGYRLAEKISNVAMFRAEALREVPWDDKLKINAEHLDWSIRLKQSHRWRLAFCNSVQAIHHRERTTSYRPFRGRSEFADAMLAAHGIERFVKYQRTGERGWMPNFVVFGIADSGSALIARILLALGWQAWAEPAEYDERCAEHRIVRKLNRTCISQGCFDADKGLELLQQLPRPWYLHDHRFVSTLHYWMPVMAQLHSQPCLLWITRDINEIKELHTKSADGARSRRLDQKINQLVKSAKKAFKAWPWPKVCIDHAQIQRATALFLNGDHISMNATRAAPQD